MKLFNLPATVCCLFAIFLITGCATETPFDTSKLQWPLPPNEAKVKYVREWFGEIDFEKTGFERLVGGESERFLLSPRGVFVDSEDNIYVVEYGKCVFVFDQKAKRLRTIGENESITLKAPMYVAVADGKVYVSDSQLNIVIVYNQNNGDLISAIGPIGELNAPAGLAIDRQRNRLYVANSMGHNIIVYDLSGKYLFKIGTIGRGDGELFLPLGITLDSAGNIYIADAFNWRIQSFTPEGKFRFKSGQVGDAPGDLARPVGLALDSEGNLYVVDKLFNNVQVFDKERRYIFTIGEYGMDPGKFNMPSGIFIDDKDRIYVTDTENMRLQVFQYLSEKYKKEQGEVKDKK